MAPVSEYRQYPKECTRGATEAKTEDDRKALLELARDWTLAAICREGVTSATNNETDARSAERHDNA